MPTRKTKLTIMVVVVSLSQVTPIAIASSQESTFDVKEHNNTIEVIDSNEFILIEFEPEPEEVIDEEVAVTIEQEDEVEAPNEELSNELDQVKAPNNSNNSDEINEEKVEVKEEKIVEEEIIFSTKSLKTENMTLSVPNEFKEGDIHPKVVELKQGLIRLGFGGMNLNEVYGSFTARRVGEFQRHYGLPETGIANAATFNKIEEILSSPLQVGKSHNDMIEIKRILNAHGYGNISVNTTFGDFTERKVKDFQGDHGLPVSGIIDPITRSMIEALAVVPDEFKVGDTHWKVIELKQGLRRLGFGGMNINEVYGSFTAQRVGEFQRHYGLPETGIANAATFNKIEEILSSPLQVGKSHNDMIEIKRILNAHGYGNISVNTTFGDFTERKVKDFQRDHGLPVSGIIDPITRSMIEALAVIPDEFKVGDTHWKVIELKQGLRRLGFGGMNINEVYGSFTAQRVGEFQRHYGLPETGIANAATFNKIEEILSSPLQVGKSHNDMIEIKRILNAHGYGNISVNTTFGDFTERKVKDFQRDHGLPVSGIIDPITRSMIEELAVVPDEFKVGDTHWKVIELKQGLRRLGFGGMNINEVYGSFTAQRVGEFQRHYGLPVTGIANAATFNKIEEILSSPLQVGKNHEDMIIIKRKLNENGYGNIAVNEVFGDFTEKRVKDFQRDYGLPVSGIIDPITKRFIDQLPLTPEEFKVGDVHPKVIDLKKGLIHLGFGGMNVNEVYGDFTARRVGEFQRHYGLTETGIADSATFSKIEEILSSPLQLGKNHEDMILIKRRLNDNGYGTINVNSTFGDFTERRIKEFQQDHGLPVSGIIDSITLNLINSLNIVTIMEGDVDPRVVDLKQGLIRLGFGGMNINEVYGSFTVRRVSEFQAHYGLRANGNADSATFAKIEEILASPFQLGVRHPDTIKLKENLNILGYGNITVNDLFGDFTERKLMEFQRDNGLPVSGIADEVTLSTIESQVNALRERVTYTQYNVTLSEAINNQLKLNPPPQTDKYRNDNVFIHSSLLDVQLKGVITGNPVNVRTSPRLNATVDTQFSSGTVIEIVKEVTGDTTSGSNIWYEINHDNKTLYVHSSLASYSTVAVVKSTAHIRQSASTSSHSFGTVSKGTELAVVREVSGGDVSGNTKWFELSFNRTWRNATTDDFRDFIDPDKNDKFQHLVLSHSIDLTEDHINEYLKGKGTLSGLGKVYVEAGRQYSVNQAYLVAHSILETGHGSSTLAKGVYVDKNGNPYRDRNGSLILDRNNLPSDAVLVYNMFGIAAVDSNPINGGARYAFEQGWTSPAKAIEGGAKWISENYINSKTYDQNTVYKMRWNPAIPGTHQYATDMGWAFKQVTIMKALYTNLDNPIMQYNIPKYNN